MDSLQEEVIVGTVTKVEYMVETESYLQTKVANTQANSVKTVICIFTVLDAV